MKLMWKCLSIFLIVIVIIAVSGTWSYFFMSGVEAEIGEFYGTIYKLSKDVGQVQTKFEEMQKVLNLVFYNENLTDEEVLANFQISNTVADECLAAYAEMRATVAKIDDNEAHEDQLGEAVAQLDSSIEGLTVEFIAFRDALKEGDFEGAQERYEISFSSSLDEVSSMVNFLRDAVDFHVTAEITAMQTEMRSTLRKTQFLFMLAAVLIVSSSFYVAKIITTPVEKMKKAALAVAKGELDTKVDYKSKDEIGELGEAIEYLTSSLKNYINIITRTLSEMESGNLVLEIEEEFEGDFAPIKVSLVRIIDSINDVMSQINQSSEEVSSGAEQVAGGAQALSQGTTEQASSIEELAATINEISSQVRNNAENAAEVNKLVHTTEKEVDTCNTKMGEMVEAMDRINVSASQVGKIIKTIEDIAFQTNLLALNAAVEAARAGSAGKGFAVVADEVRNLASKSAEAAKNTTELIGQALSAIDEGTEIVDSTQKALMEVVASSLKISSGVGKISEASSEQASAVNQITMGIEQISSVVQTNSATAEESAAASEELSGQSTLLRGLVERFTIKPGSGMVSNTIPDTKIMYSYEHVSAGPSDNKYGI